MNEYDHLVNAVAAIKSDPKLRDCFAHILGIGSSTQQVRVAMLLEALNKLNAPPEVTQFVRLLGNDKIAHQVLKAIQED